MRIVKSLIIGIFFLVGLFGHASAFLGEDLGLDLYKKIDEGLISLEATQYKYELSGQGEGNSGEVIGKMLKSEGIKCEKVTIDDMEKILSGSGPLAVIQLRCGEGKKSISTAKIVAVQKKLSAIKKTFTKRAEDKSKDIYEIARIGLYSDGVEENSPFDLMIDLEDIDRVIFSEEIEYEGEELLMNDETLSDFLTEDKTYLEEEREEEENEEEREETGTGTTTPPGEEGTGTGTTDPEDEEHTYVCPPGDESGLDDDDIDDIIDRLDPEDGYKGRDIPIIEDEYYPYEDRDYGNGASWGGPFRGGTPAGGYSEVTDAWNCDTWFCIVIEFVMKDQNLLGGGKTTSIESILSKASEHLDDFANTSLVQGKMTSNNFELGLIIPNLADMLRGFGIQVQMKPVPILNVEQSQEKKDKINGDQFTVENLYSTYYKNLGLDFERMNDLDNIQKLSKKVTKAMEKKIVQSCVELSNTCVTARIGQMKAFTEALEKTNEKVSQSIDKKALAEDTGDFYKQFVELERFTGSILDFVDSISGEIKEMTKIPEHTG